MSIRVARALGVLVAFAVGGGLAGCAGTERLPQCQGRAVPINAAVPAAAPIDASGGPITQPRTDATAERGAVDAP